MIPQFKLRELLPILKLNDACRQAKQSQWIAKFYGREQALPNHITLTDKKKEEDPSTAGRTSKEDKIKNWTERAKATLLADNQFRETITLINLLSTAQKKCENLDLNTRQQAVEFINGIFVSNKKLDLVEVKITKNEK